MKMVKCSIKNCTHGAHTDIGVSFFRFPAESARCDEWMTALGRPDLKGINADKLHQAKYRVCSVHFHMSHFSSMLLNRLKKDAIPVNFPLQSRPGPYFEGDAEDLAKMMSTTSSLNAPKVNTKEVSENNQESSEANDSDHQNNSGNEESKHSEQTEVEKTDEQTDENSPTISYNKKENLGETQNAEENEHKNSEENENKKSEIQELKTSEKSENNDSACKGIDISVKVKEAISSVDQTDTVQNGISEENSKIDDEKMETDENGDDDYEFNPLLLCPDISMDVDESSVLTETTAPAQSNDDSLFSPLFSTFVDEMTGAEISFNLTAEEQQLREKLYGPNNPIQYSKVHCTACNVHLGSALAGQTNRFVHPLLKVLICKECYHFYTSGEFEKDEDGSELYCRWCGQGGQVLCCTMCEFVFCKKCIRINFGRKKLTQVRDSDDWKCFRCDMSQLKTLRAMCVEFFEYVRKETARAATYTDSDIVNKDLTNCCQPTNRKRLLEGEKEMEKEVPKRTKRRKNEDEDPDYNPYVQQTEEDPGSPVPSTSGVKIISNATKDTPIAIQSKMPPALSEVKFPPSTVRFGNQVLSVKNLGVTSQLAKVGSQFVKSTPKLSSSPSIIRNTTVGTPVISVRPKQTFTSRTPTPSANLKSVPPALAPIRAPAIKSQTWSPMKHEWFEKTVRAAARVNSNLSYTLTQLNKAQSNASSVEQLAVVHNKLQEILSSSINSLIQIRKNLRTEFIAGIKTIRFPPKKPSVDPNDDDVIIINPEPTTAPNSIKISKSSTQVIQNTNSQSTSSTTPSKGYLKVRSFSQLQNVSSECITIPDDDPPSRTNIKSVVVEINEEENNIPTDDASKENPEKEISVETNDGDNKITEEEEIVGDKEDKSDKESEKVEENKNNTNRKHTSTQNKNNIKKVDKKNEEKEIDNSAELNGNGTDSNDSQKCNGDITQDEVQVKKEPEEHSYNINEQPTPKIRRMLSVKVNLKKTPIVENLVKQEPLENKDK